MAKRTSAGLLVFRRVPHLEVLIAHPGGPFFARRDDGGWTLPKGEIEAGEDTLRAALREFEEETGLRPPPGDPLPLQEVTQIGGKVVWAWALEGEVDLAAFCSNTFSMPWPPRSGNVQEFPEIDRVRWATPEVARGKLLAAQVSFVDRLVAHLAGAEG